MKKLRIWLLLSFGITITFYLILSLYMGGEVKNRIMGVITNFDKDNGGLYIELQDYQKGLFASKITMKVRYGEFNTYTIYMNITHQPLYLHKDNNGKKNLLVWKLRTDTNISEIFLDKTTNILRNIAIIDPSSDIILEMKLNDFATTFYRALGFEQQTSGSEDAVFQISIDKKGFNLAITGKSGDLVSRNTLHTVKSSQFSLNFDYINNSLDNSKYEMLLSAQEYNAKDAGGDKIYLQQPVLTLKFNGDLIDFIDLIKAEGKINQTSLFKKPFVTSLNFSNPLLEMRNTYNDKISVKDISIIAGLDNTDKGQEMNTSLTLGNLSLETKIDNLELNKFKLVLNLDIDKNLFKQPEQMKSYFSQLLSHMILEEKAPLMGDITLDFVDLSGRGINIGEISLKDFNVKVSLDKDKKIQNSDLLLNGNIDMQDLSWLLVQDGYKINIRKANIQYNEILNITQRFSPRKNNEINSYESNYNYKVNTPQIELSLPNLSLQLDNIQADGSFEINTSITGYMNNKVKVDKLSFKNKEIEVNFANFLLDSKMVQKYKYILTGVNNIKSDNFYFLNKDYKLDVNKINFSNESNLKNDELEYDNKMGLENIKLNKVELGHVNFDSKLYDLNLYDYEAFLATLNDIFIEKYAKNNSNEEYLHKRAEQAIAKILAQGLKFESIINFYDHENNSAKKISVSNILHIDKTNVSDVADQINPNDPFDSILNNFNWIINLGLSKDYTAELLSAINNSELTDIYLNFINANLIDFKNNFANMEIFYTNRKILVNNKDLNYWQRSMENKRIPLYFIKELKDLESRYKAN